MNHVLEVCLEIMIASPGLSVTALCMWYSHAVPFLRMKCLIFYLIEPPETHAVLNALNLEKRVVKIHNCALLPHFFAFFWF